MFSSRCHSRLFHLSFSFFFSSYASPRDLHSFPTRRSSDLRTVRFIGGLMSDFGAVGGEIYEVPMAGGTPVSLTPGFRGSDRKSTRLNSSHVAISYAVFCLKKKITQCYCLSRKKCQTYSPKS